MANGDNLVKAPSSMELMTRNLDQFLEEITLDFFTEFEHFLDSSSEDEKSETLVWTLDGPIRVAFILFCTHNGVIEIHQPCPHPPPSPTRGHAAADNLQTVMPGIHG